MAVTRQLVTLRRVQDAHMLDADRRWTVLVVDGWKVVVERQRRFRAGDLVVYVALDAFVPDTDRRLWDRQADMTLHPRESGCRRGFHVHTRVLGGHISQGLVFALGQCPEVQTVLDRLRQDHGRAEGTRRACARAYDAELGVTKWEMAAALDDESGDGRGHILGPPPSIFHWPGYHRAQDYPGLRSLLDGGDGASATHAAGFGGHRRPAELRTRYQVTEKLDGQTMAVYHVAGGSDWLRGLPALPAETAGTTAAVTPQGGRVGVCSERCDYAAEAGGPRWQAAVQGGVVAAVQRMAGATFAYRTEEDEEGGRPRQARVGDSVVVLGELLGPDIHGNELGLGPDDYRFYAFAIFDVDRQQCLPPPLTEAVCRALVIRHVPVLVYEQLAAVGSSSSMEALVAAAAGPGQLGQTQREGLVLRPAGFVDGADGADEETDENGWASTCSRGVIKVISNAWLLERGE